MVRPSITSQIRGQVHSGTQVLDMTSIFSSGKTTHALEKCWKEFGKSEWAQAMFSSTTLSPTPPSLSTPPVGPHIQMTFTPVEYAA